MLGGSCSCPEEHAKTDKDPDPVSEVNKTAAMEEKSKKKEKERMKCVKCDSKILFTLKL